MTGPSRRQFLGGALASGAVLALGRSARADAPPARPHYIVQFLLFGGYDSILCVDPRDPATAGPGIECGYRTGDLLQGRRRRYGPLFAPLMRHESDLCLVHGVRSETVNHEDGARAILRGRTTYSTTTPLLGDALGDVLPGDAPIPYLVIGSDVADHPARQHVSSVVHVPWDMLDGVRSPAGPASAAYEAPPWAAAVAEAHARDAQRVLQRNPEQAALAIKDARATAVLRQLLATLPARSAFKPKTDLFIEGPALDFALHALAQNAAKVIQLPLGALDSHIDDVNAQTKRLVPIFDAIATFLDQLRTTHNRFGPLSEQTTIVACSEFGRFPRFNSRAGKDHWPENTWILAGKGVRRQPDGYTIGATDDRFRGAMVDHDTGATRGGDPRPIYIETMGATLVKLAGGDPGKYGYAADRVLSCMLA